MSITVCPRSLDPFHIVSYYINWVKTSGTQGMREWDNMRNNEKGGFDIYRCNKNGPKKENSRGKIIFIS